MKKFKNRKEYEDYKAAMLEEVYEKYSHIVCKIEDEDKIIVLGATPLAVDDEYIQGAFENAYTKFFKDFDLPYKDEWDVDAVEDMCNIFEESLSSIYKIEIDYLTTDF